MNRLLTITFFRLLTVFFASCSNGYEQQYANFTDFNKVNQKNKGWFPDIITKDVYDLNNVSYLDALCAFGTFNYLENNFYDSIFKSPSTIRMDFSLFEEKVNEHKNRKPNWFLNSDKISKF